MLLILGTSSLVHLEKNRSVRHLVLDGLTLASLDQATD